MDGKLDKAVQRALSTWEQAFQHSSSTPASSSVGMRRRQMREEILRNALKESEEDEKSVVSKKGSIDLARPYNYDDFLSRMRTYKSSTWFAKPPLISATRCSRFGWINSAPDQLVCKSCHASLTHSEEDDTGEKLYQSLCSSHESSCAWRAEGKVTPSPLWFLSPPNSLCMESTLTELGKLFLSNWKSLQHSPSSMTEVSLSISCEEVPGDVMALIAQPGSETAVQVARQVFSLMTALASVTKTCSDEPLSVEDKESLLRQLQRGGASALLSKYHSCLAASLMGLRVEQSQDKWRLTCPLCLMASAPQVPLSRCHRSHCPQVLGYVPYAEDPLASSSPVPAGWLLALESLLCISVGVKATQQLLKKDQLHYCPSDSSKRALSPSRLSVELSNTPTDTTSSLSEGSISPYSAYKKIKRVLGS